MTSSALQQPPETAPRPAIGIVIPTFNRVDKLLTCLRHLEAQTCKDFEVIVVDDGSTDRTPEALAAYAKDAPFHFRFFSQANGGSALTRNTGIAHLTAPVCLLLGDDTYPQPDFVRAHLEFHRTHPSPLDAAIGYTRWSERGQKVTRLMRWLESDGVQFLFRELLQGEPPTWRHFYTSNLSAKTELLRQHPFDEGFPCYGMEDIELGYRLTRQRGLRMTFLRDAINEHVHPATFSQTCRRAEKVGIAMYQFEKLFPEERIALGRGWKGKIVSFLTGHRWALAAVTAVSRVLTAVWIPNPILLPTIYLHQIVGYRHAARQAAAAQVSQQYPEQKPVC